MTSLTGPNNLTTQWQYDGFGRKTFEIRADGNLTKYTYIFCSSVPGGSANCPAVSGVTPVYITQAIPENASGVQNGPATTTYFDVLNRAIRSETEGFDGTTPIYVDTVYNALGQVTKKSRPYFSGTAPCTINGVAGPCWVQYSYDAVGRVTQETRPDNSATNNAYAGLTTTTTIAMGGQTETRTKVKNSQGQVTQAIDDLGSSTSFTYDPFGNLATTTDHANNVTTFLYDLRGRKTDMVDPDMGHWTYVYDALGELAQQTDAKAQVTTFTYDVLGRMLSRTEPDLSSTWTYDTQPYGVGKLATASSNNGYSRTQSYDNLGRPHNTALTIDGATYNYTIVSYTGDGRVDTMIYPSGLGVKHAYTGLGYLQTVTNTVTGLAVWTATAMDAEGQLTAFTHGNGVQTARTFDHPTEHLTGLAAWNPAAGHGTQTAPDVQSMSFGWDPVGNLTSRSDGLTNSSENFGYDTLNRLISAQLIDGPTNLQKSYSYDAVGNISTKSDVGTYSYLGTGPHQVTSIATGAGQTVNGFTNPTFIYDANGNLLTGAGRTLSWMSFNMVATIQQGTTQLSFTYDSEHGRIKQLDTGTAMATIYLNDPASGIRSERINTAGGAFVRWNDYIFAGGQMVAVYYNGSSGMVCKTCYFHSDHLGSIAVITDENANVVERDCYDPWGKRRYCSGADDPNNQITSLTTRGFTGHEQLGDVALVHMNGRIYDPQLARFMSADPFVQDALDTQALNRYSYVMNHPLTLTDPSGYFSFGSIFHAIGHFFSEVWHSTIGRAVIAIVAVALAQYYLLPFLVGALGPLAGTLATLAIEGGIAGAITTGTLKGAAIGAGTALLFGPGGGGDLGSGGYFASVAYHAAVGCGAAVAGGGKCGPGALSAGFASAVGPVLPDAGRVGNTFVSAAVGGAASVLGGGKFANGAVTGAFAYAAGRINNGAPGDGVGEGAGAGGPSSGDLAPTADPGLHVQVNGNTLEGVILVDCSNAPSSCAGAMADMRTINGTSGGYGVNLAFREALPGETADFALRGPTDVPSGYQGYFGVNRALSSLSSGRYLALDPGRIGYDSIVAGHEVGHLLLGLGHVPASTPSIMNSTINVRAPTAADYKTIVDTYR